MLAFLFQFISVSVLIPVLSCLVSSAFSLAKALILNFNHIFFIYINRLLTTHCITTLLLVNYRLFRVVMHWALLQGTLRVGYTTYAATRSWVCMMSVPVTKQHPWRLHGKGDIYSRVMSHTAVMWCQCILVLVFVCICMRV
jgi:hypothetical protein